VAFEPDNQEEPKPYHHSRPILRPDGTVDEGQLTRRNLAHLEKIRLERQKYLGCAEIIREAKVIYLLAETIRRAANRDAFAYDDYPGVYHAQWRLMNYLATGELRFPTNEEVKDVSPQLDLSQDSREGDELQ